MSRSTDSTGDDLLSDHQPLPRFSPPQMNGHSPDPSPAVVVVPGHERVAVPLSPQSQRVDPMRALAAEKRRVRVKLLIEEEGLGRGAVARIAGWLDVSPSTIARDVQRLVESGDPVVTAAFDRALRRRQIA